MLTSLPEVLRHIRDEAAYMTVTGYPADEVRATLRPWASVRKLPEVLRRIGLDQPEKPEG